MTDSGQRLSAGRRIARGFQRIGIGIGLCVILAGIAASIFKGIDERGRAIEKQKEAACVITSPRFAEFLQSPGLRWTGEIGCSGYTTSKNADDYYKAARTAPISLQNAIVQAAWEILWIFWIVAGACFTAFAGLGWVIAGFSSDPDKPSLY